MAGINEKDVTGLQTETVTKAGRAGVPILQAVTRDKSVTRG